MSERVVLPTSLRPSHYKLELSPDLDSLTFTCNEEVVWVYEQNQLIPCDLPLSFIFCCRFESMFQIVFPKSLCTRKKLSSKKLRSNMNREPLLLFSKLRITLSWTRFEMYYSDITHQHFTSLLTMVRFVWALTIPLLLEKVSFSSSIVASLMATWLDSTSMTVVKLFFMIRLDLWCRSSRRNLLCLFSDHHTRTPVEWRRLWQALNSRRWMREGMRCGNSKSNNQLWNHKPKFARPWKIEQVKMPRRFLKLSW